MKLTLLKNEIRATMNILHINTVLGRGGAGKVVEILLKKSIEFGHLSTAAVAWDYRNSSKSVGVSEIYPSENGADFFWPDYNILKSFNILKSASFKNADVVHLHNLHGNYFNPLTLLPICLNKPTIWTLHDMDALTGHCTNSLDCSRWQTGCGFCPYPEFPKKLRQDNTAELWKGKQEIYENAPFTIVTPSKWLFSMASQSFLKTNHSVRHIKNPIDNSCIQNINQQQAREYFGIESSGLFVGTVSEGGTTNPYKGINVFVETLSLLNENNPSRPIIGLIIGGDHDHYVSPYVKVLSRATHDCFRMSAFFSALDVYLSTSIAENYPISILEAISCKVPVVGSAVGGIPEILEKESGLIVSNKDKPKGFAKAVNLILQDSKLKNKICNNASQKIMENNPDIIANKYFEVYEDILSNYHKPMHKSIILKKQPSDIISSTIQTTLKKYDITI